MSRSTVLQDRQRRRGMRFCCAIGLVAASIALWVIALSSPVFTVSDGWGMNAQTSTMMGSMYLLPGDNRFFIPLFLGFPWVMSIAFFALMTVATAQARYVTAKVFATALPLVTLGVGGVLLLLAITGATMSQMHIAMGPAPWFWAIAMLAMASAALVGPGSVFRRQNDNAPPRIVQTVETEMTTVEALSNVRFDV